MLPELFDIPFFDWPVKSYGAMLTIGFLSGVWLSMRRAERLKADPDIVLNIGFVSLLCGVAGARLFYVVHYWESSFKHMPNPIWEALNFANGGLEYYGGLIGAIVGLTVYILVKRVSLRMYTDILTPGAIWGLAFGRMGCFLNGCCWGGLCMAANGSPALPWAVTFPEGSPAQVRQWENRELTLPAELIVTPTAYNSPFLLPLKEVNASVEDREAPALKVRQLTRDLREATEEERPAKQIQEIKAQLDQAKTSLKKHEREYFALVNATRFPSRNDPKRPSTPSEIAALAEAHRSLPVHPSQIYGIINALLLSWVLTELLYRRKRHGVVFAALLLTYPVTRILLEMIRSDNPHDSVGLTISQAVSVGMLVCGAAIMLYLRRLPQRSPLAVPWEPPVEDDESAGRNK